MVPRLPPPVTLHQQRFQVAYDYPVVFCRDALEPENTTLAWAFTRIPSPRPPALVACVDGGVVKAWPGLADRVRAYCATHGFELREPVLTLPGGEACKNDPGVINQLLGHLARAKLDRHSCVLAIGGGAALDAMGYAAALVHRGLRLVRMPTTVLAQNDAGIGVKNGVNAFGGKNFLGTFAPPFAVVNDAVWLETLDARDLRAGLAEAVKVACIRDADFFAWLEQDVRALTQTGPRLDGAIRRCAELHLQHIATSGDPFETGSARPLDYGHWSAHKLELLTHHELRHGEAVAIGMLLDARYAERAGLLPAEQLERLARLIAELGLPLFHPALERREGGRLAVLAGLDEFREHLGGELTVTLLDRIGRSREAHEVDASLVEQAIGWLKDQHRQRSKNSHPEA